MPRGIPAAGKRAKGAGRKPLGAAPMQRVDLRVSADDLTYLRRVGNGNAGAGVRRLVAQAQAWEQFAEDIT